MLLKAIFSGRIWTIFARSLCKQRLADSICMGSGLKNRPVYFLMRCHNGWLNQALFSFSYLLYFGCFMPFARSNLIFFALLHCALSIAVQCIVIGPVCGRRKDGWTGSVCNGRAVFVAGGWVVSVTTITRNGVHCSSPNWVCRCR